MSDDVRQRIGLKGYENVDALGRAYIDLEQKIGAKGLIPPGKDATTEERDAFYKELGAPEQSDAYEVKVPEGVPGHRGRQGVSDRGQVVVA